MQITEGIHVADGVNGHVYFLKSGKDWASIDTGMPKNAQKILDYAQKKLGIKPAQIKTIIITHAHIDHVGSAAELKRRTGAKIAIHKADAGFLSGEKKMKMPAKRMSLRIRLMQFLMPFFKAEPAKADIILGDKDKIAGLEVIFTPGHTPGSICLYDRRRKVMFVGDLLRFDKRVVLGPPIIMNEKEVEESTRKVSKIEFDVMLSGHGQPLMPHASDRIRKYAASL